MFRARELSVAGLGLAAALMPAVGPHRLLVAAALLLIVLPYNLLLHSRVRRTGHVGQTLLFADVLLCAAFALAVDTVWVPAALVALGSVAQAAAAFGPRVAIRVGVLATIAFATAGLVGGPPGAELLVVSLAVVAPTMAMTVGPVSEQERRTRRRYGDLVGGIDAIVWESDPRTQEFTYVSRQAEDILGYPVDDWFSQPNFWSSHIHPEDRAAAVAANNAAYAAAADHELEYRMMASDGRVVWIRDIVRIERGPDGRPVQAVGFMIDVTAEKEAQALTRRYADVVERMPVAVFLFRLDAPGADRSLRLVAANPAGGRLVTTPVNALVGQCIDDVFPHMRSQGLPRLLAEVVLTGQAFASEDYPFLDPRSGAGVHALDAFPLPDRCVGVSFHDVTERIEVEGALRHQAMHDPLTELPNRALLVDRLQQALQHSRRDLEQVALLVMDLDQFKEVNDTLGHVHGDRLLQELGRRLSGLLRGSDTLARLGGDEFAVLLTTAADEDGAVRVAEKIAEALEEPFGLDGLAIQAAASIGIAVSPDHGTDPQTIMQRADVAMYVAKRNGMGYAVYQPDHDRHSVRRLTLTSELRRAVDEGELVLHYQPKLAVPSGVVVGVECLVRWEHPEHGLLPPDEFIELAEVSGLIQPLTRFVTTEGVRQCRSWLDADLDLTVAVNISVRNLYEPGFVEWLGSVLAEHGLPPERLLLEITESEVMEDPVVATTVLGRVGAMGVRISIDDFGTGYSSLSHLRQLPIDEIKIDCSFVAGLATNEHDAVIVRSIVDLGHNLGREVSAEGVEDERTWHRLVELGCDRAQGHLLGVPMPAGELARWLTAPDGGRFQPGEIRPAV